MLASYDRSVAAIIDLAQHPHLLVKRYGRIFAEASSELYIRRHISSSG
jgi:hypothetical protein